MRLTRLKYILYPKLPGHCNNVSHSLKDRNDKCDGTVMAVYVLVVIPVESTSFTSHVHLHLLLVQDSGVVLIYSASMLVHLKMVQAKDITVEFHHVQSPGHLQERHVLSQMSFLQL
ncbi:hypothetical protein MTO96_025196 [Rhipicephalus appendiculatus]